MASRALLACTLLTSVAACKTRSFHDTTTAETYTLRDFLSGLNALPGSAERTRAGRELSAWLGEPDDPTTRAAIGLTLDYLQNAATCTNNDRVRLYRGIGGAPLIRPARAQLGVSLLGDWERAISSDLRAAGLAFPRSTDNGALIFANLGRTNRAEFGSYGLPDLLDDTWADLTSAHSLSAGRSALISTTLQQDLARELAGSGNGLRRYLVLDVCPERALPITGSLELKSFDSAEVYVPLFILPEEITALVEVARTPHGQITERVIAGDPAALRAEQSQATRSFRSCYFNFDLPLERSRELLQGWVPPAFRTRIQPEWMKPLAELTPENRRSEWRKHTLGLSEGVCRPSCERTAEFVQRAEGFGEDKEDEMLQYRLALKRTGCR